MSSSRASASLAKASTLEYSSSSVKMFFSKEMVRALTMVSRKSLCRSEYWFFSLLEKKMKPSTLPWAFRGRVMEERMPSSRMISVYRLGLCSWE